MPCEPCAMPASNLSPEVVLTACPRLVPLIKLIHQLRRHFHSWTKDLITLSPNERSMMGLDRPLKSDQQPTTGLSASTSEGTRGTLSTPAANPAPSSR
jgi:hypothetical protein